MRSWLTALGAVAALALVGAACSSSDSGSDASGDAGADVELGALIDEAPEGDAFYDPPDPIPGEPGDVIWARDAGEIDGGHLYVVLYHSNNLRGESIATSGWIAVPDGDAPAEGRPVLAWGHGTRGAADECAPTIGDDPITLDVPILTDLLDLGLVVSATDYEGLGTPGLHPYVIGASEAYAVLDAARAAQRFAPADGNDTVVLAGHSQGGHATAFANEYATEYAPELDVIGAVGSGAGVVAADSGIVDYLINSELRGVMVLAVGSQLHAYGEELAPANRVLTDLGAEELGALEEGCWGHIIDYYQQFTPEELFRPDYDFTFTDGQNPEPLNEAGNRPGVAPMVLVHGTADEIIPAQFIPPYVERVCAHGQDITVHWYEGYPHHAIFEEESGAGDTVVEWIEARLAGEPAPTHCGAIPPIPGS